MSTLETVKRVAKETWGQRWFKWGIFMGLIFIAVFLPLASNNPDGLERVAEDLALYTDILSYVTGIEFSAIFPIFSYIIGSAPFPDYYLPQLYPMVIYELYYSPLLEKLGVEIPELLLYKLGEMLQGAEYLSKLIAAIAGFFITLGSAWLAGLILKKREQTT
ncbi:MAG: PDGLE domain-containing protein [Candidatus Jordarchaeaceae archaeon]